MRGVPSRRGFRRIRIIDGPQSARVPIVRYASKERVLYVAEGVSTAEKGAILVGHRSDAFQVTQQFTCFDEGTSTHRCGLRKMAEWSIKSRRLSPCQCYKPEDNRSETQIAAIDKFLAEKDCFLEKLALVDGRSQGPERVLALENRTIFFVYISNPAARWLQLGTMYELQTIHDELKNDLSSHYIALVGPDTCLECAVRLSKDFPDDGIFLL